MNNFKQFNFLILKLFLRLNIISFFILLFCTNCAKVVSPSGGEIDKAPPVLLQVQPPQKQIALRKGVIVFKFDEFFTLKSPSKGLILSPLVEEELKYEIKGKQLLIHIPESIKDSTTYSILLNNVIADYNEGNILPSLKYTFSTGEKIDSLLLSGKAINAVDGKFVDSAMVFLMPSDADSAMLKKQFAYITFTEQGSFQFENISSGSYNLFLLKDKDQNFIYSNIDEQIAFYPESIEVKLHQIDDSTISKRTIIENPLLAFTEKDTILKLLKSSYVRKGLAELHFNLPVTNLDIIPLTDDLFDSIIVTRNENLDSAKLWLINVKSNILNLAVNIDNVPFDTISLLEAKGRNKLPDMPLLNIKQDKLHKDNVLSYFDTLRLKTNNPIKQVDSSKIFIISNKDTLIPYLHISQDNPLFVNVICPFEKNQSYNLHIKDSTFVDYFEQRNKDSLSLSFKVSDDTFYGRLKINMEANIENCHIIQLKNEKGITQYEFKFSDKQSTYLFENIVPSNYSVYLIYDDNCNGKWDSGQFLDKILPEKTELIIPKVELRSNWTNEINLSK